MFLFQKVKDLTSAKWEKDIQNPTEAHKGCIKIHTYVYDHVARESAQKGM